MAAKAFRPAGGDLPAREMLEDASQNKAPRQRNDDEGKPDGKMFAKVVLNRSEGQQRQLVLRGAIRDRADERRAKLQAASGF